MLRSIFFIALLTTHAIYSQEHIKHLQSLYHNKTGFGIPETEYKTITSCGGAPTYGEITPEGTRQLFDYLNLTKDDVIYDLGSGIGKFVIQAYLSTPVKKAAGAELSPSRIKVAREVVEALRQEGSIKPERILEFKEEDIAHSDVSDATVVYLCSTCFSNDLLIKIANNAAQAHTKNIRIVTLKKLPQSATAFKLTKTISLPMTWSEQSSVHIYERAKPALPKEKTGNAD